MTERDEMSVAEYLALADKQQAKPRPRKVPRPRRTFAKMTCVTCGERIGSGDSTYHVVRGSKTIDYHFWCGVKHV